jgi:hypothetical protein
MKFRDAYTKRESFDFKRQFVFAAFSVVTTVMLVYFREGICDWLNIKVDFASKVTDLLFFFIGYFSDSVWKNIEVTGTSKLKINNDEKPV